MKRFRLAYVLAIVVCAWACSAARADDAGIPADIGTSLAKQLEAAVNTGNTVEGDALFDRDVLLDRTMAGITVPENFSNGFRSGVERGPSILGSIINSVGKGDGYRFLRLRQIDGETRALCRLVGQNQGLNYNDWVFGKDSHGQWKFVDCYTAKTGELMSQTLRHIYLTAAVRSNPALIDTLTGAEKSYAGSLAQMRLFLKDYDGRRYDDAMADYKKLPPAVQETKWIMVERFNVALNLKTSQPQESTDAVADFQRLFPGDPCLDLISLDSQFAGKQFDEATKSLDRLDAFTGGDAYLLYMRGKLYMLEGGDANLATAKQLFQKASDTEPTLINPVWGLIYLSLKAKDFDQTAVLLDVIVHKFHIRVGDLTKNPEYAEFVQSPNYASWKAAYDSTNLAPTTMPN